LHSGKAVSLARLSVFSKGGACTSRKRLFCRAQVVLKPPHNSFSEPQTSKVSKELAVLTEFNLDMNKIMKLFNDSCKHPKPTEPTALKLFNDQIKLTGPEETFICRTRTVWRQKKTVKSSSLPMKRWLHLSPTYKTHRMGDKWVFILVVAHKDIYAGNDRPHYQCKLFTCEEDAEGRLFFFPTGNAKYECLISKRST
jgi:hypothetical protein